MIRNVTRELEAANEAVGDQEDVCDVALVHKLEAESEVRVAGPPQRSAKRREEVVEVFMGWQKRAAQQGASRLRALRGESNVLLYRVAFAQDELVRARRERANMGLRPKNVRAARFVARRIRTIRQYLEGELIPRREELEQEIGALPGHSEQSQAAAGSLKLLADASLAAASAKLRESQGRLQRAEGAHAEAARLLEERRAAARGLEEEDARGRAAALEPRLWKRAALPTGPGVAADGFRSRHIARLAASMKMDWCVASRSAAGEAKHWDIREFLDIPEVQSVRELEAHGERGRYLLATTDGQAAAVKVEVPARVGCQVQRRSADWTWGDQDGGPGKFGKLLGDDSTSPGWVRVQWDNGATNTCRAGAEGKWDLDYVDAGAETKKYLLLSLSLLTRLRGPTVKSPPMQLNFFELLRSSLGDPQFQDVWLIPEAPHFHEVALGLDRQKEIRPPASLARILRPYQVSGFQWLAALARNGLGAILADDMGLGKTIQAITMLVHLYDNGLLADEAGVRRPGLVVVPPGLLRNWQQEFQQWAPQLEIYLYHGPKRELPRSSVDVMLTTYHMVRNDVSTLCDRARITFSCMVIDEAQCIKNHGTKLTKAVKEVGNCIGHTRIALSGTPIENKVDELHSLFDFTMYGYLGDQHRFSREFSKVIEQGRNPAKRQEVLALLKTLTSPFQMRRLKTDPSILPDLPEKINQLQKVEMTAEQQRLYQAVQQDWQQVMVASRLGSDNHKFQRRGHIFAMLEKVRNICSHPLCLDRDKYPDSCRHTPVANSPEASGKMSRLFELLAEILGNGEKVIIFVTRKKILSVLGDMICSRFPAIVALKFSGDLTLLERNAVETQFAQDPQAKVLIITVQCGGIGLNLVAASHVIHFDRCYNPAKEAQATDRCHRMGQQKVVLVHRLVSEGTYEERLEEIMQRKQDLSSLTVTQSEDWIADYDDQALFDLFMLRSTSGGATRRSGGRPPAETPRRSSLPSVPEFSPSPAPFPGAHVGSFHGGSSSSSSSSSAAPPPGKRLKLGGSECSICMDKPGTVTLLPCSHAGFCRGCAWKVSTCPMCRQPIVGRR